MLRKLFLKALSAVARGTAAGQAQHSSMGGGDAAADQSWQGADGGADGHDGERC